MEDIEEVTSSVSGFAPKPSVSAESGPVANVDSGATEYTGYAPGRVASDGYVPASYEQNVPESSAASAPISDSHAPVDPVREETYSADPTNAGHGGPSPEDLRAAVADGLREARHEHDASDVRGAPGQYGAPAAPEPTADSHLPANPAPADETPLGPESVPPQGSASGSALASGLSFTLPPSEYSDDEPVDAVEESEALIWPGEGRRSRKKRSGFFDDDEEKHDE